MKVIKDNYNVLPKEVTCSNCNSVILLENEQDIKEHPSIFNAYLYTCPVCGRTNVFKFFV